MNKFQGLWDELFNYLAILEAEGVRSIGIQDLLDLMEDMEDFGE